MATSEWSRRFKTMSGFSDEQIAEILPEILEVRGLTFQEFADLAETVRIEAELRGSAREALLAVRLGMIAKRLAERA